MTQNEKAKIYHTADALGKISSDLYDIAESLAEMKCLSKKINETNVICLLFDSASNVIVVSDLMKSFVNTGKIHS